MGNGGNLMIFVKKKKYFFLFIFNLIFVLLLSVFISKTIYKTTQHNEKYIKENVLFEIRLRLNEDNNYVNDLKNADNSTLRKISEEINSYEKSENTFLISRFISILFLCILLLGNYLFMLFEQKKYIRSVDEFIDSIKNKDFDVRLNENDESIISNLNNRFNKLGVTIRRNYSLLEDEQIKLRQALQDISHQIKTPLAALNMYNEILLDSDNLEVEQKEFVQFSQDQIERLNWLITSLLKIAKFEAKTIQLNKEKFKISDLSKNFEDIFIENLQNKNLKIKNTGDLDAIVNLDYKWTSEALLNIVKNATEHADKNSIIEINYSVNIAMIKIEISNKGNKIPTEELSKLFTRFYKSSLNKNPQSIGIGLNLSKNIIESQGGTITVQNNYDGVQFNIIFLR